MKSPIRLRRMLLRRGDGLAYLERWGIQAPAIGGIFVHRMGAPDPGTHLHDHPYAFVTIPLVGGYTEERAEARQAPRYAAIAEQFIDTALHGHREHRRTLIPRLFRLDEAHRIVELDRAVVWTLVLLGPRRRRWGFYMPGGWIDETTYDATVHRDLWNEAPDAFELEGRAR